MWKSFTSMIVCASIVSCLPACFSHFYDMPWVLVVYCLPLILPFPFFSCPQTASSSSLCLPFFYVCLVFTSFYFLPQKSLSPPPNQYMIEFEQQQQRHRSQFAMCFVYIFSSTLSLFSLTLHQFTEHWRYFPFDSSPAAGWEKSLWTCEKNGENNTTTRKSRERKNFHILDFMIFGGKENTHSKKRREWKNS